MIRRVSDIDFILDVRVKINNVEEVFIKFREYKKTEKAFSIFSLLKLNYFEYPIFRWS